MSLKLFAELPVGQVIREMYLQGNHLVCVTQDAVWLVEQDGTVTKVKESDAWLAPKSS